MAPKIDFLFYIGAVRPVFLLILTIAAFRYENLYIALPGLGLTIGAGVFTVVNSNLHVSNTIITLTTYLNTVCLAVIVPGIIFLLHDRWRVLKS